MKKTIQWLLPALFLVSGAVAFGGDDATQKVSTPMHKTMMFEKHFSDMDTDANNELSPDEFKAQFPGAGDGAFSQLDTDGGGSLSHDEWEAFKAMHKGMGSTGASNYHSTAMPDASAYNSHFPDMDTNGDDQISLQEFQTVFPDDPHSELVFKSIDTDNSGSLDHDEWHAFKQAHGMKHKD